MKHPILRSINRIIRRWNYIVDRSLGFQFEPQTVGIFAGLTVILFIHLITYFALSSQTIYCHLPNMRLFFQARNLPSYEKLPTIYVITPTYDRHVQKAELTRLSHTLMLVPNIHWIIVEDSDRATDSVSKLVRRLKNEFEFHSITQLHSITPDRYKLKKGEPSWRHPKGVWQRNRGLDWIRDNLIDLDHDGVIYFADDDNTYDLEVFNEMRYTRKVSVWPVGFVGGLLVEKPVVRGVRVHSFNSMWESKRPFPLDMAGFAISLHLFMGHLNASFSDNEKIGYVESNFLGQLVSSWDDLEPKADRCSRVLVWHTKSQNPALHEERKLAKPSSSEVQW